jgi:LuxR family maltose regulon positive regulatory protein
VAESVRRRSRGTAEEPSGAPVVAQPPLAEAKLAAPRQLDELVSRPRIERALDAGRDAVLTLVSAPAGYGKSTAVRAWCASRGAPFAWVTLDAGDNDPVRMWRYVATSVDRVREGLGRAALQRLARAGDAIEVAIDELMNGIAAYGSELVVVLDDLHLVTQRPCLELLEYALEHEPATAQVVAITRIDPQIALPRLRARGVLCEVRADELAFTRNEVRELLVDGAGIALGEEEIDELRDRTAGWPAALYLAGLWLRNVEDRPAAVRAFGARHRFVADFLASEVLGALDEERRDFVLRASVLGRFTPQLCDGVLERSDSAEVLAELERSNLFVRRLERGNWYRIHSLLAEYAILQLASANAEAARTIHRRAAIWLHRRGMAVEAAEHASAAGEHGLVAELLREYHLAFLRAGSARTLLRWARTLPDDVLTEHPDVAAAGATAAATVGGQGLERRRLLRLADRARTEHPEAWTPYAEAVSEMVRATTLDGGVAGAVASGRRAVELSEGEDEVLVAALAGYAMAQYFAGDLDEAWSAALRAVEHPDAERRPGAALARSSLALVAANHGWLDAARGHAESARSMVGRVGISRTWLGANVAAATGVLLMAEGRFADAERELSQAEHFFRDEVASLHHAWLLVLLAHARCGRGRLDEADATLRRATDELDQLRDGGRVSSLATEVSHELEEARGRAREGEVLETPTDAELAVLRLLASDLSTRQIGGELFLSPNTVRSHTRALYRKLGVSSRPHAVARATALGLLGDRVHLGEEP